MIYHGNWLSRLVQIQVFWCKLYLATHESPMNNNESKPKKKDHGAVKKEEEKKDSRKGEVGDGLAPTPKCKMH